LLETIAVQNPLTKEVIQLPFPCVAFFGTEENCIIMLIPSRDPMKCGVFRGNLHNEPELRTELFNNKQRPVVHWNEEENKPEIIN